MLVAVNISCTSGVGGGWKARAGKTLCVRRNYRHCFW